jgi:hypothetical protein
MLFSLFVLVATVAITFTFWPSGDNICTQLCHQHYGRYLKTGCKMIGQAAVKENGSHFCKCYSQCRPIAIPFK